jgi:RHS repeat-associated protein
MTATLNCLEGAVTLRRFDTKRNVTFVRFLAIFAVLTCFFSASPLHAQSGDIATGLTPYQSFHGGDIDSINLSNGNLMLRIPLASYPQRGAMKLSFSLVANTASTHTMQLCSPVPPKNCTTFWSDGFFAGVVDDSAVSIVETLFQPSGANTHQMSEFAVVTSDGAQHPLVGFNLGQITGDATEFWANSGFDINDPPPTVIISRDGVRNFLSSTSGVIREDSNGNEITLGTSGYTDTMGRVIAADLPIGGMIPGSSTTNFSGCTGPLSIASATIWSLPTLSGGTMQYKFCQVDVTVNIPAQGVVEAGGGTELITQSIVLPNGTAWTFEYDNYGLPTQVTLPTGGTITYTYATAGIAQLTRVVTSRTLNANDGAGPHTWHYSGYSSATTVTDPLGNDTVHTFTAFGLESTDYRFETETLFYQGSSGSGTLLKTVQTDYDNFAAGNDVYQSPGVVPIHVTTTLPNGQVTQVQTDYDSNFSDAGPIPYGNVIARREYDYGSGTPGALLRTTTTQYEAFINSTYLTNNLLSLPSSVQTTDGGGTQRALTTYSYDSGTPASSGVTTQHDSAPPDGTARGNQTSVARWLNTTGGSLTSSATYFDTGEVRTATDPKGNSTTFAYSSTYAGAYPTTVTNALSQSTTHAYDFNTGLLTSTTDPNSQTTSFTYDNMWRIATATYPDGGSASITRQETTFPFTATLTKKITSSLNYVTTNTFDGVGRVSESLVTDQQGNIETDTTYDADGRKYTVSNPYRTKTDSTYGVTTYVYDALGRTCVVIPPDGTAVANTSCPTTRPSNDVFTVYTSNTTTVTDQQGKSRESQTDGLGRLTTVWENPSGLDYETVYTYDALDDLATVVQGGSHNRTFVYDSLKRLTSSTNPEAGAVAYTYDADGNVATKLDARSITITYGYDKLNRLTGKTYSNSDPAVGYTYDQSGCLSASACFNIGRRTGMTDAAGSESWAYDKMGRELAEQRITNSLTESAAYTYNLDGTLATLTYPSGRKITYTTDAVERPSEAQDVANAINYATGTCSNGASSTGVCYAPQGAVALIDNGASVATTTIYNDRLQPCWIYATTGTALAKTTTCTATATAGTVLDMKYNFSLGTADNGNVMGITNDIDNTRSQTFTYDQVNRIITAQTPSSWSQSFTYDQWANLTAVAATGIAPPLALTVSANNQITTSGFSYDAAANETSDVTSSYVWNAESELKTAAGVNYTYDGDGDRVEKSNGTLYWYGAGSQVLMETGLSGNLTSEYVYFGGKRVARRDASNNIYYYTEDMLGSSRAITTSTGTVCYNADFYPYGSEHALTNTCPQNYKFDGKERDAETSNDDFGARFYSSTYGRFLSADWSALPVAVPYANLTNPQTLNLYAMVSDNPETFADLDGHVWLPCQDAPPPAPQDQNAASPQNTTQIPPDQSVVTTPTAVPLLEKTMAEIDKVVEPLIESASELAAPIIGALSTAAAVAVVSVAVAADAPAANANEGKMLQQARTAEDAHNSAEHKKGARESTRERHQNPRPGRGTTKDRQKPGWKPRTPPRPQDMPPKED